MEYSQQEKAGLSGFQAWYNANITALGAPSMWDNNRAPYLTTYDLQQAINRVIITEQAVQKGWSFEYASIQAWRRGDMVRRFEAAIADIRKQKEGE